jgi:hypothetical protein
MTNYGFGNNEVGWGQIEISTIKSWTKVSSGYKDDTNFLIMDKWCGDNTTKRWCVWGDWYFENSNDAMLFKLKFC